LFSEKELDSNISNLKFLGPDNTSLIKKVIDSTDFTGELKQNLLLYPSADTTIKRLLLVGYGKPEKIDNEKMREIGFVIGKKQKDVKAKNIHIVIDNRLNDKLNMIKAIAEGFIYSKYSFNEFKSDKKEKTVKASVSFLSESADLKNDLKPEFKNLLAINDGIKITRDLANIPSNHLTPRILKKKVKNHFKGINI
ncbi:MAG: M17 family peptidase N-terminal domain-containing protein, partial [Calditrichaceae bacterium]